MLKNYFYLARYAGYLNDNIVGLCITEVFTQEKDTLYIRLEGDPEFPFKHLVLCTNNALPYLLIKEDHRKAKKNVATFFPELFNAKITSVDIALGERDIRIITDSGNLHYVLRGNLSNVYFINQNYFVPFKESKKGNDTNLIKEFESQNYYNQPEIYFEEEYLQDVKMRKKEYPFISKEVIKEADILGNAQEISLTLAFEKVIEKIYYAPVAVYFDDFLGKVVLCPANFISFKIPDDSFVSDDINSAVREFLILSFKSGRIGNYKKELEKYFDKELHKLSAKINNLKERIEKGPQHEVYYNYGKILLSNIYALTKGSKQTILIDFEGNEVIIPLNEKLNPNENAEFYFDKAKNEKINFEKSSEIYTNTVSKYEKLVKLKSQFETAQTADEFKIVYDIVNPDSKKNRMNDSGPKIKYRHYLIDSKYHVFVGKDSQSNDLLSTKFAKQNDYWFHARGLPGSHVVLRVDNTKEIVPKNIIKNAASIAAFWSKAKTAKIAPVSYTFGKYVYKKKGFDPGQVSLTKETVLLVKPEIPANTEIVEE